MALTKTVGRLGGPGVTLDAGALIAVDRGHRATLTVLQAALSAGDVHVPAGAVAQAWRNGSTQHRLGRLLSAARVRVVPLDDASARAAGLLCGLTRTSDVVDASVAVCARRFGDAVLTSDPEDLRLLAPDSTVIDVSSLG